MRLRQFIEQLQQLERRYGSDLPVEIAGMAVLPPVINPIIGRYTVAIYCDPSSDKCEGPDDCDAHHPCIKHAAGAPSLQTWEESDLELMDAEESKQR